MADDVRFVSSSIKLPAFLSVLESSHHSLLSSLQFKSRCGFASLPFNLNLFKFGFDSQPRNFISEFLRNQSFFRPNFKSRTFDRVLKNGPLFCSASSALADFEPGPASNQSKNVDEFGSVVEYYKGDDSGVVTLSKSVGSGRAAEEERVLISEVLVRNKDGEELERKDLEAEALNALKASRANSALTVREVKEDVHRIIGSGYFMSCMPVAVDTRDGIRLIFQVFSQ